MRTEYGGSIWSRRMNPLAVAHQWRVKSIIRQHEEPVEDPFAGVALGHVTTMSYDKFGAACEIEDPVLMLTKTGDRIGKSVEALLRQERFGLVGALMFIASYRSERTMECDLIVGSDLRIMRL